ncbi:MAG: diadenylate cyclase CdaA [Bdellovibrionota bacterium]|jgi:diadenylate cyclase|nr:diadenylate cyclase CdaA [Bdellovibrionota bacterium]
MQSIFSQLTLKDGLDIIIVAFLIYQGLLIVYGTRAVQMLTGVGILVGLFWVGHSFKLYSLNWLLDHFFDSFFIIAIILFQDQFRNALATFGTGQRFFGFLKDTDDHEDINEIVEACQSLSREKIGALIVVERTHGLANFLATGSRLDSKVHSDLLYALFQSSSPLHDGAVIITKGRVAGAGCFLPLSRNVEIDRHLGTRHRAALGISEDTDAVGITVSEETGRMNISVGGSFYPCENVKVLRQYLKHLVAREKLDETLMPIKFRDNLS